MFINYVFSGFLEWEFTNTMSKIIITIIIEIIVGFNIFYYGFSVNTIV